jgi:hypothetical protein
VHAVQEVGEKKAGELEGPRDEGGKGEHEHEANGELVDDHIAIQVEAAQVVEEEWKRTMWQR